MSAVENLDFSTAIQSLEQARAIAKDDLLIQALQKQSEIFLLSGDGSECFRVIKDLQKVDANNKFAKIMLAHIAFRRKDFDHTLDTFKDYFKNYPHDWLVLSQSIPSFFRMGQMKILEKILAEMDVQKTADEKIGRDFCFGLFKRFSGDFLDASNMVGPALGSIDYGLNAAKVMIEILCNWDRMMVGSQYLPFIPESLVGGTSDLCNKIIKVSVLVYVIADFLLFLFFMFIYNYFNPMYRIYQSEGLRSNSFEGKGDFSLSLVVFIPNITYFLSDLFAPLFFTQI